MNVKFFVIFTQPRKVERYFLSKVLSDVVQWLVLVPFPPTGPVVVENLPLIDLIWRDLKPRKLKRTLWKTNVGLIRELKTHGFTSHQAAEEPYLTSCRGKAAAYAPSFTSLSTPTSALFFLPYTVLARISYTCNKTREEINAHDIYWTLVTCFFTHNTMSLCVSEVAIMVFTVQESGKVNDILLYIL